MKQEDRQCQKPDCGILGKELYFTCFLGCGTVKVVMFILCSMRPVFVYVGLRLDRSTALYIYKSKKL
jgi:hypothetical protein